MRGLKHKVLGAAAALAGLALAACADDMMDGSKAQLAATLSGTSAVPPIAGQGRGMAAITFDKSTKMLTWEVTYSGLTGPATAAHFHGPAAASANAGVVVPIAVSASPMKGSATLTDAQIADLTAGKWYVNIHTDSNKGGEIRGQVMAK
ncbi:MAG: CHRD domain-containing protein [Proteobacteria bacterium]|nr:CHRD domain-containing protein [Pseudomonadota bacterium]